MLRISKLTDYALVILSYFAKEPDKLWQTGEISSITHINTPTVAKVLKQLVKVNLLTSVRGTNGGYRLSKNPNLVSVSDIIEALEGPLAIMECNLDSSKCLVANSCGMQKPWNNINKIIRGALSYYKLSHLIDKNANIAINFGVNT